MQKITPHFWYNTESKEATALYTSVFPYSHVDSVRTITGTPSGDCDIVSFTLSGEHFMAISAGPYFTLNPSISLFTIFSNEHDIDTAWQQLAAGGKVLMEYQTYPWAQKYGWLQDRYGLSWQLSLSEHHDLPQVISPALMFTGDVAGRAQEAMNLYVKTFSKDFTDSSKIDMALHYGPGEGDKEEFIKHGRFSLAGQSFIAMDSSAPHAFGFNEAVSFIVNCDSQEEINYYWEALTSNGGSESQCGWLKDPFGVSWQIVSTKMQEYMSSGNQDAINRVTQSFLKMKKFDVAELEKAFRGE